ncbi:MAG: xanthine dehydrogenase small subunit [Pseudomonadota bacterium]
MRNEVQFILNGKIRRLDKIEPTLTVLRYLREEERSMGSKEGCAEGDCGACTAVLAELEGDELRYRAVNTCIQFVGTLDGKALLTVEYLKSKGELHPVQKAMVDEQGSQCGFCTPGFVMSMFAGVQNGVAPQRQAIDDLLAGNLCRCTGYTPIINAAKKVLEQRDRTVFDARKSELVDQLKTLSLNDSVQLQAEGRIFIAPSTIDELADVLLAHPEATVLAGGTDVGLFVTKKRTHPDTLVHLGKVAELAGLSRTDEGLRIGAAVTYERAWPELKALYPGISEMIRRIGATQVRNLGTIGGNIANGSPIGDMPPALIAADATLRLRRGKETRELPLEQFFIAYGKQDRAPSEFIESILVPRPDKNAVLKAYKITKRIDQDISSVCGAFNLTFEKSGSAWTVADARICFGGMAGTPLRASECEAFLKGRIWNDETVTAAEAILRSCYKPLSDWRASADYRSQVAGNLLRKYFIETTKERTICVADRREGQEYVC